MQRLPMGAGGVAELKKDGSDVSASPIPQAPNVKQVELDRAYDRVQVNAQLVAWLRDLSGRIEQQKTAVALGDFQGNPHELRREFERLKLAFRLAKERRA